MEFARFRGRSDGRMSIVYRVGGYVKLAKLWENSRDKVLAYHREYYEKKCNDIPEWVLQDVYVDITGQKKIEKRPEMLRLLCDCQNGQIDCIAAQTKAYLAANSQEFCYLIKFLFEMPVLIELVTEDEKYQINTIVNPEHQKEALGKMAEDYAALDTGKYLLWRKRVLQAMQELCEEGGSC